MAYQGCDTFDHYNNASEMYETVSAATISSAYTRFPAIGSYPNQGMSLYSAGFPQMARKNLKSNQATEIPFISFGVTGLPSTGYLAIACLLDAGTCQVILAVTPTGALQFCNGAGNPIGPPSVTD